MLDVLAHVLSEATGALEIRRESSADHTRLVALGALGELVVDLSDTTGITPAVLSRTVEGEFVELPLEDDAPSSLAAPADLEFQSLPGIAFLIAGLDPATPAEIDVVCVDPLSAWTSSLTSAHLVDLPHSFNAPDTRVAFPADVLRLAVAVADLEALRFAFDDDRVWIEASTQRGAVRGWVQCIASSPALSLSTTAPTHRALFPVKTFESITTSVASFCLEDGATQLELSPVPLHSGVSVACRALREKLALLGGSEVEIGASSSRTPVMLRHADRAVLLAPVVIA